MPIPNRALVLVVDGRKMLFFRNEGDTNQIDLRTEAHEERDDANHDGDLKTDYAVWKSDNSWSIRQSSTGTTMPVSAWGFKGSDIAVQGDYDSDGKTDKAVWRPSNGTWYIVKSNNGNIRTSVWGVAGDIPVPAPYRR